MKLFLRLYFPPRKVRRLLRSSRSCRWKCVRTCAFNCIAVLFTYVYTCVYNVQVSITLRGVFRVKVFTTRQLFNVADFHRSETLMRARGAKRSSVLELISSVLIPKWLPSGGGTLLWHIKQYNNQRRKKNIDSRLSTARFSTRDRLNRIPGRSVSALKCLLIIIAFKNFPCCATWQ